MTPMFPFPIDIVFHPPERFWFVSLLILLVIPIFWEWLKRNKIIFDDPWNKIHISTSKIPTTAKHIYWCVFFTIATGFLVVAYANPEKVTTDWERVFGRIRITFILDISRSMKKAEDVSPNRLEASKELIRNLTMSLERDDELKGKYTLALIPFSGAALPYYTQFTTSRDELLNNLESLDTETITKRGTSLWAAVVAYDELLLASPARERGALDLGIIITDGGKEEGKKERALIPRVVASLRDPYRDIHFLNSGERIVTSSKEPHRKVVIYSVGVGKVEIDSSGNHVAKPVLLKNRDKLGNFLGYQYSVEGDTRSPIDTTTLDEQILKEFAEAGGGKYWHFSDLDTIRKEFKTLIINSRQETDRIPHERYESVRSWFLVPSFVIFYFLFGYDQWLVKIKKTIIGLAFLVFATSSLAEGHDSVKMKEIFEKSHGVVLIETYKAGNSETKDNRNGTGVVITLSSAGEFAILTNDHIIGKAEKIYVSFYKRGIKIEVTVIGRDPALDIAILRISEIPRGIATVKLGDSSLLNHGDEVYALGHPFGARSITVGNITAMESHDWRYIVSQTPLNPGNSGGPLFNKNQEMVAINTAIVEGANLVNFSIPINYIKRLIPRLVREHVVRHATLGFVFSDSLVIPPFFFKNHGIPYPPRREEVIVVKALQGAAGTDLNIREGDAIIKFNGASYTSAKDLSMKIFFDHMPGDVAFLTIGRDGQLFERNITLQEEPPL